jgi:hypothetical protein
MRIVFTDKEAENAAYTNYIKQLEEEESKFQDIDELEREISEVRRVVPPPYD